MWMNELHTYPISLPVPRAELSSRSAE
jgi:hypothetical protein